MRRDPYPFHRHIMSTATLALTTKLSPTVAPKVAMMQDKPGKRKDRIYHGYERVR